MTSNTSLEERMAALEAAITQIQEQIAHQVKAHQNSRPG